MIIFLALVLIILMILIGGELRSSFSYDTGR